MNDAQKLMADTIKYVGVAEEKWLEICARLEEADKMEEELKSHDHKARGATALFFKQRHVEDVEKFLNWPYYQMGVLVEKWRRSSATPHTNEADAFNQLSYAVIEALITNGILAWNGDGVSIIVQMIMAQGEKRIHAEERAKELEDTLKAVEQHLTESVDIIVGQR